jgi:hypothetical protein
VEEIADAAGIAPERVRWFEGPVLAERAYVADQAQAASVRRHGDSTPGPPLGEVVTQRLSAIGADPDDAQWDAKKRGDGSWQVQLTFTSGGRLHTADWVFDPRRRHVLPADDNAARMSLPGAEPPQPAAPAPGEATVTQLAPRIGTVRHERPGSGRPVTSEPAPIPAVPVPPAPIPAAPIPAAPLPAAPILAAPPAPPAPAEPRRDDRPGRDAEPRRPAAERTSWPRSAPQEPAPAPRVAAEAVREDRPAAPPAAEPATGIRAGTTAGTAARTAAGRHAAPAEVAEAVAANDGAPEAEPAAEQTGRQGRKSARGRRSSVPSWDEIMFGSSRQRD